MQNSYDNPFYDFVLVYVGDPIPSTRSGFKKLFGGLLLQNRESRGVQAFRKRLREGLREYPQLKTPYRGRVLVSLAIKLAPKEYEKRDLDDMVKSLFDTLRGVAYNDDRQVVVLNVVKQLSDDNRWHIGIKSLADDEPLWHFPSLYLESAMGWERGVKGSSPPAIANHDICGKRRGDHHWSKYRSEIFVPGRQDICLRAS